MGVLETPDLQLVLRLAIFGEAWLVVVERPCLFRRTPRVHTSNQILLVSCSRGASKIVVLLVISLSQTNQKGWPQKFDSMRCPLKCVIRLEDTPVLGAM